MTTHAASVTTFWNTLPIGRPSVAPPSNDDIVVDFTPSLPERSAGVRRQSRRLRPVIIDRVRFSWWTKLARTTPMMWMMTRASVRFASTS